MTDPVGRPTGSAEAAGGTPLKILLLIESAGGGSGRHVIDLSAGLLDRGHHVTLLYSPLRADAWFVHEVEAIPGLELASIRISRAPGLSDILAVMELRRFVRRNGPFDIIHGHSAKAGAIARLGALGVPATKVYTPHAFITLDPFLGRFARAAYGMAERILASLGDLIICVSEEERDHAVSLGIEPRRLRVVNNGLLSLPPADRGAARARMSLADNHLCIGCVGRLSDQKSIDRLLKAFAEMRADVPQARLVVVGTGPRREALERLAGELGISETVRFQGAGHGAALMAGFDVYAMSSVYEAFPYVYLEALARGLPIVTTPVGGSGAVVQDGVNGRIADGIEPTDLAACLVEVCADGETRASMARASLRRAERFSSEAMVDATLAAYEQGRS